MAFLEDINLFFNSRRSSEQTISIPTNELISQLTTIKESKEHPKNVNLIKVSENSISAEPYINIGLSSESEIGITAFLVASIKNQKAEIKTTPNKLFNFFKIILILILITMWIPGISSDPYIQKSFGGALIVLFLVCITYFEKYCVNSLHNNFLALIKTLENK